MGGAEEGISPPSLRALSRTDSSANAVTLRLAGRRRAAGYDRRSRDIVGNKLQRCGRRWQARERLVVDAERGETPNPPLKATTEVRTAAIIRRKSGNIAPRKSRARARPVEARVTTAREHREGKKRLSADQPLGRCIAGRRPNPNRRIERATLP